MFLKEYKFIALIIAGGKERSECSEVKEEIKKILDLVD